MDKFSLYDKLLKSHRKAYPLKSHDKCRKEVVIVWNEMKTQTNVDELVNRKCIEWKAVELKSKSDFFSTWKNHSKPSSESSEVDASTIVTGSCSNDDEISAEKQPITDGTSSENVQIDTLSRSLEEMDVGSLKSPPAAIVRSYDTPAQMKLQKRNRFEQRRNCDSK